MKKILTTILLLTMLTTVAAQSLTVTGKVIDDTGLEVIGANVTIKGRAGVGTISNLDGHYSLAVDDAKNATLIFSYIGMTTQEVPLKGRNKIDVTLKDDARVLDEVVVTGYGSTRRGDLTGSVVSVKSAELMQTPTSDATQALVGRVAGVQVSQTEGEPGASISIRVRGGISITQSNEPLYVIDGFPSEDGMASLDPAEIESIDILKDASSTAIYGARGANGVVVVTTKKGNKNDTKMTISLDSYIGIKQIARKLPVLSPTEFVTLDYERNLALNGEAGVRKFQQTYGSFLEIDQNYAQRPGIDWQEEALGRVATAQNYRVRLTGGNKELKYGLGYTYFKELGAMIESGTSKHNISLNLSHKGNDRFEVNARVSYDQTTVEGMGTSESANRFNKMEHILQYRPVVGLRGNDSDLIIGEDPFLVDDESNPMQSPIISAREEKKQRIMHTFQANGGFTFKFNQKLSLRNSTGMRYQVSRQELFYGAKSIMGKRSSINGTLQYNETGSFQTSNVLNYDHRSHNKKHRLGVMLGQEYVSRWTKFLLARGTNFPNNDIGLDDMSLSTPADIRSGVSYDDYLISFFARANYNLGEKYLLTATLRADGSSKFSANNKWGFFPSLSAAWRLSEEEFIKRLDLFSDLKLRVGYGMAGNNRVAAYKSLDLLSSAGYPSNGAINPGYAPMGIPSEGLKWESNRTLNIGLDMGFLEQRITISPEFYINNSSSLLLNSRVPSSSGFTNVLRNVGKTRNMGVDLAISSANISSKRFSWTTNFNISHNRNTIQALSGEAFFLEEAVFGYTQKTHKVEVGKPIGQFYGYRTVGLYQVADFDYNPTTRAYTLKTDIPCMGTRADVKPGMWKFANTNNDQVIDEADMTVIGNASPDFYGGLNNSFTYRQWDLGIFFTFSYGAQVMNATKLTNTKTATTNYSVLDAANSRHRWMTIDANGQTVTDPAQLSVLNAGKIVASLYDMEQGDKYVHSWAVEDASFFRLSNINLGYTFSKQQLGKAAIQSLRLYATGSNLWVWTPYTGFDPEVSTMGNGLTPGVDYGAYPRSRSFIFGLNITF